MRRLVQRAWRVPRYLTWGWGVHCCTSSVAQKGSTLTPKGLATVFPEVNTHQRVCLSVEMKHFYDLGYLGIKNEGGYSTHVNSCKTDPELQGMLEGWLSPSLRGWGFFYWQAVYSLKN